MRAFELDGKCQSTMVGGDGGHEPGLWATVTAGNGRAQSRSLRDAAACAPCSARPVRDVAEPQHALPTVCGAPADVDARLPRPRRPELRDHFAESDANPLMVPERGKSGTDAPMIR